jgi:hypothetical protein
MGVLLVDLGLLAIGLGTLSCVYPLRWLGIRTRRRAAAVLSLGALAAAIGALWPAPLRRSNGHQRLDAFLPAFHFYEFHSIRIHASPQVVDRALRAVTPRQIRWLHELMAVRRLPARLLGGYTPRRQIGNYRLVSRSEEGAASYRFSTAGATGGTQSVSGRGYFFDYERQPELVVADTSQTLDLYADQLRRRGATEVARSEQRRTFTFGRNRPSVWVEVTISDGGRHLRVVAIDATADLENQPILEVMLNSGFVLLDDAPGQEIVIGAVGAFWQMAPETLPRLRGAADFAAFRTPGSAKVAANFAIGEDGPGWSRLTTETRIFAPDPVARRAFGAYWRVIYPGSSLIRHSWLEAVRERAERAVPETR